MLTTIPSAYFSNNLYADLWGDPGNSHAVDVPAPPAPPHQGKPIFTITALARHLRWRLAPHHLTSNNGASPACI